MSKSWSEDGTVGMMEACRLCRRGYAWLRNQVAKGAVKADKDAAGEWRLSRADVLRLAKECRTHAVAG